MNTLFAKCVAAIALLPLAAAPGGAKEFTYDEKANAEIARKLGIPVYFAVPASARAPIPADIKTKDRLYDFKHPDGVNAKGDIGLRVVVTKRAGMGKRLGESGLFQTGDILLSLRPEWSGAGAYPSIQMGVSHAGIVTVEKGELRNFDNPMNEEYLGRGLQGRLDSAQYRGLKAMHVIRPRNLTDEQRAHLLDWITRLRSNAKKIYPAKVSFNDDYNAPKYQRKKPLTFVHQLGQIALGQAAPAPVSMFCSEFVWSILSLRDCDAKAGADAFGKSAVPSCVKPAMTPLSATGNVAEHQADSSYIGLADGPLVVINTMGLPEPEESKLLRDVFTEDPSSKAKLSSGHREVAEQMQPKFAKLEKYYLWTSASGWRKFKARVARTLFNRAVPDNYSPTSYLINTLLPPEHPERQMDYVATILIE